MRFYYHRTIWRAPSVAIYFTIVVWRDGSLGQRFCDFHFLCLFFLPSTTSIKCWTFFYHLQCSNPTCPHCRQECSQTSVHRIYLPENNFLDQDSLVERMNDINRQKIEYESKYKKNEQEKKSLERELKQKNKEFHKVVQRSKNIFKGGESDDGSWAICGN